MASFTYRKNREEISYDLLPAGPLKEAFQSLRSTITDQIRSLQCEKHQTEPVIVLDSDGTKVWMAGFSTCCKEFATRVKESIKVPAPTPPASLGFTTKEIKYVQRPKPPKKK